MTLLLREALWNEADYLKHYNQSRAIWLLFLPLFLADAGLFIWWLSRKIGRPLRKLNDAVVSQSEGRLARVGECGGTLEIRRIGESFDRFSDRLAESERQRRILDEGRQKLIADISHDLKTPITVIAGYIDAICDGKVPPEEADPVPACHSEQGRGPHRAGQRLPRIQQGGTSGVYSPPRAHRPV